MKITTALAGIGLLCLMHTTSDAGSLDVPADYKEHANQVEFLSHLASRCDIDLSISGKKALTQAACTAFLAKVRDVMTVDKTTSQRWVTLGTRIDQSTNRLAKVQWATFHTQLMRDMEVISKTMNHIKFVH